MSSLPPLYLCLPACLAEPSSSERESVFPPWTPPQTQFDWVSYYTHHYPEDSQGRFLPWFGRAVGQETSPHGVADMPGPTEPYYTANWFDDSGRRNPSPQV